jgi:hypothetical protein
MMTNPPTDGWEGACELDELQGFLKFSLDSEVNVSLDIDMRWALYLARRGLLFLSPRFAGHRITAVTLLPVKENDLGLWILDDGIFWAGQSTGRVFTMVTK